MENKNDYVINVELKNEYEYMYAKKILRDNNNVKKKLKAEIKNLKQV